MFPLSNERLPLHEIAGYWSREIKPYASQTELLAKLESAWWLGKITGNSVLDRLTVLKNMFKSRASFQKVVFITPYDSGPSIETLISGGEVVVDIRPRINVPGERDRWTQDSCIRSFETLAALPSHEWFPELSRHLHFIDLTPEEYFGWIASSGFDAPTFWKRHPREEPTNVLGLFRQSPTVLTGRGSVGKVIQQVCLELFPNGLPVGTSSADRDRMVQEAIEKILGRKPNIRTIQRAITKITQAKS
jgi:hypothetical protein